MKRTGFKHKTLDEVRAIQATKRSKLRSKPIKPKKGSKVPKTPNKGYKPPKWFNKIKAGAHGNTPAQKRYWKVVSDTYRLQDFNDYKGKCVSCHVTFERWQDGQLGHYKAWSVCNSWFKYERKNLALQCGGCNRRSDGPTNEAFKKELQRRHGNNIIDWIEKTNECFRGQKMEVWELVERTARLRPDLVEK